jgi:mannosyltransferase OCH1-like enzyme
MLKIHHILLGNRVPPLVRECLDSWTAVTDCGFEFHQWTDASIDEFMKNEPVVFQNLWKRAKNYGEAGDILRYTIVGRLGGLYVDWDVLLLDPHRLLRVLGDLTDQKCLFLEDRDTQAAGYASVFASSLFYMQAGNPLTRDLLLQMEQDYVSSPEMPTAELTGPMALTRHLNACPHYLREAKIVNLTDVYSFNYGQVQKFHSRESLTTHPDLSRAPAIHFWTHEWTPRRELSLGSLVRGVKNRVTSWLPR